MTSDTNEWTLRPSTSGGFVPQAPADDGLAPLARATAAMATPVEAVNGLSAEPLTEVGIGDEVNRRPTRSKTTEPGKGNTPGRSELSPRTSRGVRSVRTSTHVDLFGSTVLLNVFSLPVGPRLGGKFRFAVARVAPVFRKRIVLLGMVPVRSLRGRPLSSRSEPLSSVSSLVPVRALAEASGLPGGPPLRASPWVVLSWACVVAVLPDPSPPWRSPGPEAWRCSRRLRCSGAAVPLA